MGRAVARVIAEHVDVAVVAAADRAQSDSIGAEIGGAIVREALPLDQLDVVIDFSSPAPAARLFDLATVAKVPVVTGTTGLTSAQRSALVALSKHAPVVAAPNYSQGVTVMMELARVACELLGSGFDAEIIEVHHRHKVDAPSGTAARLAEVVCDAKEIAREKQRHGREGQVGPRPRDEVGVHAVRASDVVGEHTLVLAGDGERIELIHRATDRTIFARGAVRAARWVIDQPPGLYDMADVMR